MNEVKFKANIKDLASLQATVSEIPEIPTPESTDEGKVLTVSVDSSGETPVAEYDLAAPASGLPAIASGDAGKVLTVNAGETGAEWSNVNGGGLVVNVSDDGYGNFICDKTAQEIIASINSGIIPLFCETIRTIKIYYWLASYDTYGSYSFTLSCFDTSNDAWGTYTANDITDYPLKPGAIG